MCTEKHFKVELDHKPLEMINLKNLSAAPKRLQGMLLKIQPYDFEIIYRPGKEMAIPDALSRSPSKTNDPIDLDVQIHMVQFSQQKLQEIRENSLKDPILHALGEVVMTGWPRKRNELPKPLHPYWSYRDELSMEDGIILKGYA